MKSSQKSFKNYHKPDALSLYVLLWTGVQNIVFIVFYIFCREVMC